LTKIDSFTERSDKNAPKELSGVPLVIYRTWITTNIPVTMKEIIDKSIALTPEFDNYFFSDEDCIKFIQENYEPNVANAFRCLKPGAFKSDLWRYCILYKKGGVYIDNKMELHLPLFDILKKYPKIFIGNIPDEPPNPKYQVWNGLMSSPPGNPVFKACIDEIVENCKNRDYKANYLDITGPCLLWRMIQKLESPTFLSSLPFYWMKGRYGLLFNDKELLTQYDKYRSDQTNTQKTPHYTELWNKKDVFDTSVEFTTTQQTGGDPTKHKYVSSHGILKLCDVHSHTPAFRTTLDGYDFSELKEGCTLSLIVTIVPEFAKVLDKLPCRVILVTGDCDPTVPEGLFKTDEEFKNFIESDKIIHWFAQNCVGKHDKLSGIPIGVDYNSPLEEYMQKSNTRPFYERIIQCYSNFHLGTNASKKYGYNRRDALDRIPSELLHKESTRVSHEDTFANQSKYAFVISPHGNGLDCHRTWEALVLGCIPIVKTSKIDYLYESLPVLIVKDWGDITKELLEKTVHDFKNRSFKLERITMKYWMDLINSKK